MPDGCGRGRPPQTQPSVADDIIARHELLRQMLDHGWLHLFRMDDDGGVERRVPGSGWQPVSEERLAEAA